MNLLKSKNVKDNKVRYQTREFTGKLVEARSYKRKSKALSENSFFRFLQKIGLYGSLFIVFIFILIFFVIYVLYFSSFFKVEKIEVNGGNDIEKERLRVEAEKFLDKRGYLGVPRSNLLTLGKGDLRKSLLENIIEVRNNLEFKKKFPNTLVINADFRKSKFIIGNKSGTYLYFDDSQYYKKLSENPASFFDYSGSEIKIWWQGLENEGRPEVDNIVFENVSKIKDLYFPPSGNSFDFLVMGVGSRDQEEVNSGLDPRVILVNEDLGPGEAVVYTRWFDSDINKIPGGFKVYLDTKTSLPEVMARAELVIDKRPLDKRKLLYYIDMRYENRAFLCEMGSVCAQVEAPKVPSLPGTEINENLESIPPHLQTKVRGEN